MCKIFNISRSGYYYWMNRKLSQRGMERQQLAREIEMLYKESRGRY